VSGVADFDNVEWVAFQLYAIVLRGHGGDVGLGDLAREELVPQCFPHRHIGVHLLDGAGGGDDLGAEPVGEHACGEPMITVSMGNEDMGEVLVAGLDLVAHGSALRGRKGRVNQNGGMVTVNQRVR
jgi:hypothetical protein